MGEFGPLVSFRVALGSGLAFLAAQLTDMADLQPPARARLVACALLFDAGRVGAGYGNLLFGRVFVLDGLDRAGQRRVLGERV